MSLVSNRREVSPLPEVCLSEAEIDLTDDGDRPAINSRAEPASTLYTRGGKRALDIVLSVLLLVGLAPVFAIVTWLVRTRLGSGGAIFRQRRIGLDGAEFTMYKFRSMLPDRRVVDRSFEGPDRRRTHKSDDDPRHRPLGRFLRSASLDELPQLWNVLKGEMSLVGPRPEVKEIAIRNHLLDHPRHRVRPGITGPFQVSELRFEGRLELGFEMDTDYTRSIGLVSDCGYLLQTLAAPFTRRGR